MKFKLPNHVYDVYVTFILARTKISALTVSVEMLAKAHGLSQLSQQQDDLKSPSTKYLVIEIFTCMARLLDPNHLKVVVALGVESNKNPTIDLDKRSESPAKEPHDTKAWSGVGSVFFETGKNQNRPL